jgi:hypothetical protein
MRLGDEFIELTEYLVPKGRPTPLDLRCNDRWFQHIAIIVSDMDKACTRLRRSKAEHASSGPQRLPDWNKNAPGISAFYFKDPYEHPWRFFSFPLVKAPKNGAGRLTGCFSASITRQLSCGTPMRASTSITICSGCASLGE